MKTNKKISRSNRAALIASGSLLLGSSVMLVPNVTQALTDATLATTKVSAALAVSSGSFINCTSSADDAICTLSIRLPGASQLEPVIELSTMAKNIYSHATGYHLSSDVTIKTPQGDIALSNVDLQITLGSAGEGITGIQGSASLPFPKLGFLKNAEITQSSNAIIGMDKGSNLMQLGAHLNPDRHYLVFHFDQGLSGTVGPMTITAPGGHSATFVLDPSDPYFYIGGSGFSGGGTIGVAFCDKTPEECAKTGEDYGFGMSLTGQIPFDVDPALPFADALTNMKGHLVLDGTIPLGELPLSITGTALVNIDSDNDGFTFFDSPLNSGGIPTNLLGMDTKIAAKGTLDVSVPFLKVFEISLQLAEGTVLENTSKYEKSVYFNGVQDVGTATIPILSKYLPLTHETVLNVTGHFLIDTSNFDTPEGRQKALESMKEGYLIANGDFGYDATALGALANVNLSKLLVANAKLTLDKNGFALAGKTNSNIPIPYVGFTGGANVNLDIPAADVNASALTLKGDLNVAGVTLGNGALKVSSNGAVINGQLNAVLAKVNMSGTVTRSAVNLTGATQLAIPLSKFSAALGPQLSKANTDLQNATNTVNSLNNQISQQRQIVQAEHNQVAAQFQNAQQAVTNAQNAVNSLQNQINNQYAAINQYNAEIGGWQNWYNNLPWYQKIYSWAQLAYETGWRGTAIGGLYVYIGTLEASKAIANGTLTATKQTLAGINAVILNIPVDSDPRVAGLIVAVTTANGTLRAAQSVVNALPKLGDFNGSANLNINNNGLKGDIAGNYTFTLNGNPATVGVNGTVIVEANQLKACLNIPGANNVCVAI